MNEYLIAQVVAKVMQFDTASPKGRAHIEEYLQNAAAKKKELDKELNASLIDSTLLIKE